MNDQDSSVATQSNSHSVPSNSAESTRKKQRKGGDSSGQKRRCVSIACIACRKRKTKCDAAVPSCAACARVYGTECVYDPNSDHRRRGVYREKVDSMKARNSTLQILIEAILNATDEDVLDVVAKIRTCDNLDDVADELTKQQQSNVKQLDKPQASTEDEAAVQAPLEGERELARTVGELRLENGSVRFIGGTSHLMYLHDAPDDHSQDSDNEMDSSNEDPVATWSRVTKDSQLITHLINMYFTWHYPYFTTLSKKMFFRDFLKGKGRVSRNGTMFCSSLLVNAMLALGCHFTSVAGAYGTPGDSRTKGDHFFAEAKRLIVEHDEYERPRLVTVQALALMSVREAGCARETKGWVYSGMSFRMAGDIGLNLAVGELDSEKMSEHEVDARRITFWGCFTFDKCWSNYLGRLPQLPRGSYNVQKVDVFPDEDADMWSPYTDNGFDQSSKQPARTRAISIQLTKLCEISSDLLVFFYHPSSSVQAHGKHLELKKLSELHRRLEDWRMQLPKELEPQEGLLPNVILMHMFFHLQYIHLFRPFLKYTPSASPLPPHVSPRRICTANAGAISKLLRLYKKSWNLRQICNIAVYMVHSACTIHLLNLPEKTAKRDITHGLKQLEEIAEDWLCARRTLSILSVLSRKWSCELPDDAMSVLQRVDEKYGTYSTSEVPSPRSNMTASPPSDGSSLGRGVGDKHSPLTQYTRTQLAQTTPTVQIPGQQPLVGGTQSQQEPVFSMDSSLFFDSDTMAPWVPAPLEASTRDCQPMFAPMGQINASSNRSGTGSKPASSSRSSAVDGPEWFLNDGARWQQSFETWDMASQDPSAFMFRSEPESSNTNPSFTSHLNQQPDISDPLAGFDGLDTSLDEGGWLPDLE